MPISVRVCEFEEIAPLRDRYRREMNCQIIHDSLHARPGWSTEHALQINRDLVGYGSVAIGGPWANAHALYEFYVLPDWRQRTFDLFAALRADCAASAIETQTNAPILPALLHTFAHNIRADAILFEDRFETHLAPNGAEFRAAGPGDVELLLALSLDDTAGWVATLNGVIAGAGGVLYHYTARTATSSRRTLQKAGFVPCGNIIAGALAYQLTEKGGPFSERAAT